MSYTSTFFDSQLTGSRRSADRIAPIIMERLHPRSVVDVGCGVGTWLAAFKEAGARDVLGLDGDYVDRRQLQIEEDQFQPVDLLAASHLPDQFPDRRFDLAISLEVGEHLPPSYSYLFVELLTNLAPAVLFSAAIPRQSGTDHINERWQSEWAGDFAKYGYYPHDVVRPDVWDDQDVEPWYAQNMLLYLPERYSERVTLNLVHPRLWEKNLHNADLGVRARREALRWARQARGALRR
jgi:SAM-dependent methyltransferase